MATDRPDDSSQYDDETLLAIVAERFAQDPDPTTRRDAAWLVSLAREALRQKRATALAMAALKRFKRTDFA